MRKPPDEVEIIEISEEAWVELKAKVLAELKAIPEWWDKLAECHVKCSRDEIGTRLAYQLWFIFSSAEIAELYAEAERIRNAQED